MQIEQPKPVIETVTEDAFIDNGGWLYTCMETDTPVTMTFNRINGVIDLSSYRLTSREVAE